ncbi:MAG: S46 family peptidase [Flavobacteriales bacterium]
MKKIKILLASAMLTLFSGASKADEGMWLPILLGKKYAEMQKLGLKLTAEDIYSVNKSSLKDAIVALGGGFCTGEMISKEGLMLTNHHCGYDAIQKFSTTTNNYLRDGFWAMSRSQEIHVPGLTVWFLDRMEDVTDKILKGTSVGMTEGERAKIIQANIKELNDASQEEGKRIQIKNMFSGNEYYMFVYNIFSDVRLVGAPPESIGKFGGDTDNWMWPRHTGDFCMFRVYSDKDNNPSEYKEDNVPYKPKHHLPVSLKGVEQGDYAMVMGYPGSTDRYLTSYGVKQAVELDQPARVKIRGMKLDIMKEFMDKDESVRIQYASKYARISNYWKYFMGQSEQLVNNKVYDKKKTLENQFQDWVNAESERKEIYGDVLKSFEKYYAESSKTIIPEVYFGEAIFGVELHLFIMNNFGMRSALLPALKDNDATKIAAAKKSILDNADKFYKDYDARVDQKIYAAMLELYYKDVDPLFHPTSLENTRKKFKGFDAYAAAYFAKSPFTSKAKLAAFLDKVTTKSLENDMAYKLFNEFMTIYIEKLMGAGQGNDALKERADRLFIDGIRKLNSDKFYAPNANSTMRVTYGSVLNYEPKDGVLYKHYTTLRGVIEKEDPTNPDEFTVPAKLKELYNTKNYGQYADKNGDLVVNFLTNNDITGGNSGSPTINANGELIGTAFDGNWEAMSGDIYFEPDLQRTIVCDIRYVLFIVDKYAGAGHLVQEMTIVK